MSDVPIPTFPIIAVLLFPEIYKLDVKLVPPIPTPPVNIFEVEPVWFIEPVIITLLPILVSPPITFNL